MRQGPGEAALGSPAGFGQINLLAALIFTLLLAVYGLTFSGTFTADDEHIFVSGAQSLARFGRLEAPQVYGNSRVQGDYRSVEPAQAFLGSLVYRWARANRLGETQSLFVLNIVVTALTACLVFAAVAWLGFRQETAVLAALAYGLASMAWPYAKTYFRDPLAALLLAAAFFAFEAAVSERHSTWRRLAAWGLVLVCLAIGVTVKSTVAVAIPIFAFAAVIRAWRDEDRSLRHLLLPAVGGLLLVLAFLAISIAIPPSGAFARLSWPYLAFLLDFFVHSPRHAFTEAMWGPLISPGKSLFVYSPVLAMALISTALTWRTRWRQFVAPWLILLALILAQALFYDDEWWGHTNWGLRYLLPALPPLIVVCAPALESLLSTRSTVWRTFGWGLIGVSLVVQIGGVAAPVATYYTVLAKVSPDAAWTSAIWAPQYSAVVGHWRMLLEGVEWNLAWARVWPINPDSVALVNVGWVVAAALSAWGIVRRFRSGPLFSTGALAVSLTLCAGLLPAMLKTYYSDLAYSFQRTEFHSASRFVAERAAADDVILAQSYSQPFWHFYMNYGDPPVEWYSLPLRFPSDAELSQARAAGDAGLALDPSTIALFERLPTRFRRVWLINDLDALPGSLRLEEAWLADHYSAQAVESFNGIGEVRVMLFALRQGSQSAAIESANAFTKSAIAIGFLK